MVTVASRPPLLRELCALRVEVPILTSRTVPQASRALSLFSATLTDHSQPIENAMALSPAFATLTGNVNRKPFVCHSYKKQVGWGYPASSLPQIPPASLPAASFCARRNARNTISFISLLHNSRTPGGGVPPIFPHARNESATSKCYPWQSPLLGLFMGWRLDPCQNAWKVK